LKYIGPFLRINKLKKENINNQLFYLAKESLNQIVLYSKCGVYTSLKELKIKNISNFDINTFKDLSPLLCIYRKASPKLINVDNKLTWNEDKFKKEINIDSNSLMTLCLLELSDYYEDFKDMDTNKYNLSGIYRSLSKKQLEFYASYFRNHDGVFIDKKIQNDLYEEDLKFEEKDKKFSYSSQAFLMAAFYKCSYLMEGDEKESYKNFSLDILNMFIEFKEELYELPSDELTKLCLGLNIFYKYSGSEECKLLLLDLCELLCADANDAIFSFSNKDIERNCLKYTNYILLYKNTGIIKFRDKAEALISKLLDLYDPEKGIFIKDSEGKDITFSCSEIILYLLVCIIHSDINEDENKSNDIIIDIFKHQLIDSGIILSWPEAPDLNNIERYRNYSLKADDLIEEQNFRMPSIPTPESYELAPVFAKHITYNKKKETFKDPKLSFDSYKNMLIFFSIIHILTPGKYLFNEVKLDSEKGLENESES
jgi:hypothetical protein